MVRAWYYVLREYGRALSCGPATASVATLARDPIESPAGIDAAGEDLREIADDRLAVLKRKRARERAQPATLCGEKEQGRTEENRTK